MEDPTPTSDIHYPHCVDGRCPGCVPLEVPPGPVICRTTRWSTGCGHPVDDHTGPGTIRPDCPCCSWREADPVIQPVRVPPPAGFSPEKWNAMPRRERRAALRARRR